MVIEEVKTVDLAFKVDKVEIDCIVVAHILSIFSKANFILS